MRAHAAAVDDFEGVYRDYLDVVLAFCLRRVRDPELAADLAAETFASALLRRETYDPERGSVLGWLFGIAGNKSVDALRRGAVQRRAQRSLGMRENVWSEDDFSHVLEVGSRPMETLLSGLPPAQRDAVRARIVDDRSYIEIASVAGTTEQVARKRVSRGLATMRRRMTKEPE